jgi:hypothetical protein
MKTRLYLTVIALLVVANVTAARAHNFWYLYWPRSDMQVFLVNYVTEAEAARLDWATNTHVQLRRSLQHTDISVLGGDYGRTGWAGLTEVKQWGMDYPWRCGGSLWCRMIHVHSRFNSYYRRELKEKGGAGADSDVRGVFCMEIGHALGLAHDVPGLPSSQQDCMGKNIQGDRMNVTLGHSWDDVNRRY